jgi:hypothetical protein
MRSIAFAALAGLSVLLATAFPSWAEFVTGWDLDAHDGSLERAIAAGFSTLAVVALGLAVMKRRRAVRVSSGLTDPEGVTISPR